ncbi:hypothetical protein K491DRAFT_722874 [Lophiostoma macrostomum CBS 122681]|uniref:Metalloendopeptidase n=1 Tax=Lophiostoma macrostomum CBS 122681 TaxID=1314788 RepID=A0A6A6SJM8_9PLEO|nr:hypothetical protein K491DRAFT_722874 [Lophiostoma macrostomum CBS 122681]
MKLALLLAPLALACPPPFNDFRFLGNETVSTETLVRQALAEPQFGSIDGVSDARNPSQRWARNPMTGATVVEYCFANKWVKRTYADILGRGWMKWFNKIRNPSQANGHSLIVRPAIPLVENRKEQYCYLTDGNGPNDSGAWNNAFPKSILIIKHWDKSDIQATASATVGWNPKDSTNVMLIHPFLLRDRVDELVDTVAHELGHVFGLLHEHQRPDREHYIKYECRKLMGYAECERRTDRKHTMEEICKSSDLGYRYDFPLAAQMSTENRRMVEDGREMEQYRNYPRPYDLHSIMHYSSRQGAADQSSWREAPLVKWKNGGPGYNPPQLITDRDIEPIYPNTEVSDGDADAIRYLYPW